MAHDFVPAQAAAQHCAELLAHGNRPEERSALIGVWRREVARELGETLGALLAGERLTAEVSAPEWPLGSEALARIGPVAANCLLRCGTGDAAQVLLSLDHATALALAERSFGGAGRVGEASLDPLPRSAQLVCDEVAALVAGALARARQGAATGGSAGGQAGEVIIRSENAARLRALDPGRPAALFTLRLADAAGHDWRMLFTLPAARLDDLLPPLATTRTTAAAEPAANPAVQFGTIPLALRAVLAEIDLTLSQLERLAPGDLLPIPMPRSVPLRIGEALVAQGSIGTLDDRLALCLTEMPSQGLTS